MLKNPTREVAPYRFPLLEASKWIIIEASVKGFKCNVMLKCWWTNLFRIKRITLNNYLKVQ